MRTFSLFVHENGLVIEGRKTGKKEVKMKAGCFLPLRGVIWIKKLDSSLANDWKAKTKIGLFIELRLTAGSMW